MKKATIIKKSLIFALIGVIVSWLFVSVSLAVLLHGSCYPPISLLGCTECETCPCATDRNVMNCFESAWPVPGYFFVKFILNSIEPQYVFVLNSLYGNNVFAMSVGLSLVFFCVLFVVSFAIMSFKKRNEKGL